jgi:hypothetical protein
VCIASDLLGLLLTLYSLLISHIFGFFSPRVSNNKILDSLSKALNPKNGAPPLVNIFGQIILTLDEGP